MSQEIQCITTKHFITPSIMIYADAKFVYLFVADPKNLPLWTNAFKKAVESRALKNTPARTISRIGLKTIGNEHAGTID